MPIYAYKCDSCGRSSDVLVRNGHEPQTCDDIDGACVGGLTRLLSAPYVAKGGVRGPSMSSAASMSASDPSSCGHCGQVPGSCGSDN